MTPPCSDTGHSDDEEFFDAGTESHTPGSQRKRTSWVYSYLSPQNPAVGQQVKCNKCIELRVKDVWTNVVTNKGFTSNASRHLKDSHDITKEKQQTEQTANTSVRAMLQMRAYQESNPNVALVAWVTKCCLPISVVDTPEFRTVISAFRGDLTAPIPRRTAIMSNVTTQYFKMKEQLLLALQNAPGRLTLTMDMWTAPFSDSFMSIGCHWIDEHWNKRRALLSFEVSDESHTADNLMKLVKNAIEEYGIARKVGFIVSDSARNNVRMTANLAVWLHARGSSFQGTDHIRCIAHVIQLGARKATEVIDDMLCDIRTIVRHIKKSTQRTEVFKQQQKKNGVVERVIPLDVDTRWNSTYLML